ncbi:TsoY family (seleno)protein [Salimicrobium flavidum]|uniref:Uncharacterized protein n=1 Tax=Salimicrobium flavidum TaxID=570947 RepID=A0A1N7J6V6_9BACI|nr:hypothetical protein [Salimicrobium flavidum]SIS45044.1 hypothetical protein SAMN05421687_10438 [Salimicrobium flavidum]
MPGLWNVIEYLFPFALAAFFAVGFYALALFKDYFTRFMIRGDLDFAKNNNLSHMLTVFAFAMIAVGFAAPAAMSHSLSVSVVGMIIAIFSTSLAVVLMGIKMILGFTSIFEKGIDKGGSPSVWISIPILTLLGITFVRLYMGVSHNLMDVAAPSSLPLLLVLTVLVSLQVMFGFIGFSVLKNVNYFHDYVDGKEKSAGSYALI